MKFGGLDQQLQLTGAKQRHITIHLYDWLIDWLICYVCFFRLFQSGQISPAWDTLHGALVVRIVGRDSHAAAGHTAVTPPVPTIAAGAVIVAASAAARIVHDVPLVSWHTKKKHGKSITILLASYPHSCWGIASLFFGLPRWTPWMMGRRRWWQFYRIPGSFMHFNH